VLDVWLEASSPPGSPSRRSFPLARRSRRRRWPEQHSRRRCRGSCSVARSPRPAIGSNLFVKLGVSSRVQGARAVEQANREA